MEGISTEVSDRTQRLALVGGHDSLCSIFYDQQVVALRDVHDGVHFASHTSIMHRHDRPGTRRDGCRYQSLVYIQCIRADVHKHRDPAAQHEGIGRGNKGIGRHDHLITGLDIREHRRHIQRRGA